MKICNREVLVFAAIACFFLSVLSPTSDASEIKTTALTGSSYTIFIYNSEIGSSSISFGDDLLFTLAAHEGVGFYLPIGTLFTALYWAPNFDEESDLFLIFNGVALADFIVGWGLSFPDYQIQRAFLFIGHAEI